MKEIQLQETFHNVRKIAILRANGIGDFIFSLPALDSLRAAYPEAEIVLLGKDWHAEFLHNRPGPIDRVEVAPVYPGVRDDSQAEPDLDEIDAFFVRMAGEGFDLAIQLHGGGQNSNPFVRRLGARYAVGLKAPDAIPLDRWAPYVYFQSEIMRCLEVATLAGAPAVTTVPRLRLAERDMVKSCQVVADSAQPLVALNPGAGDGRRRWRPEKFAAVGQALARAGAQIVITGAGWDQEYASVIQENMAAEALNTCGQLPLDGLAGLVSRCSLVISNDSGPLHLAAAVGTPTVGIYWCGNLINADPLTRTHHRPVISWQLECGICGRNCIHDNCEHHASFVRDVAVDEVLLNAFDLLGGENGDRRRTV